MKNNSLLFKFGIIFFLIFIPTNVIAQEDTVTTHEIIIKNFSFSPSELSIEIGDVVVFKWIDGAEGHNVEQVQSSSDTSYKSGFRSGNPQNGPLEWILPSNYVQENITLFYICDPHVFTHSMGGKIIVGDGGIDDNVSGGNLGLLLGIFVGSGLITVVIVLLLRKKNNSGKLI